MDLRPYIDDIQQQLTVAAEAGGDEARALAERLAGPLEAAIRLALQDALTAAAEQITCELAPGSVELRLRSRQVEFVVTPPPTDVPDGDWVDQMLGNGSSWPPPAAGPSSSAGTAPAEGDEGGMSRVNLRMPDQLKARVEQAATTESLSVNAWLVRAATAALDRSDPGRRAERPAPRGAQRHKGWAR